MKIERVYIDAVADQAHWRLWGMTLLERVLRQLDAAGVTRVLLRARPDWRGGLRPDYRAKLDVVDVSGPPTSGEPTLVLDAAAVFDARVLRALLERRGPTVIDGVEAVRVVGDGVPESVELATLPSYLKNLRRHHVPYVLPIRTVAELKAAERTMFTAVYKGVTDVVTRFVYPGLVRLITKWLAPTTITPNQVTAVSMVLSFGAIPVFLAGYLGTAVVMGLVMSVLDSVDGKLARLTLRESTSGNWMDHGSDVVYFFLWLVAVGLVVSGATWWLLPAAWVTDRLTVGAFTMVRKRELNDYGPIDSFFRLIVIRRNVFLLGLGAGVLFGAPGVALTALLAWTLFGFAFHLARIAWIFATGEPARASRLHGGAP